jgi:hypothetical protein
MVATTSPTPLEDNVNWQEIGPDVILREGDVVVGDPGVLPYEIYKTGRLGFNNLGFVIAGYAGSRVSRVATGGSKAFRNMDNDSPVVNEDLIMPDLEIKPRRLPMNPIYSTPLPLP